MLAVLDAALEGLARELIADDVGADELPAELRARGIHPLAFSADAVGARMAAIRLGSQPVKGDHHGSDDALSTRR